MKKAISFLFGIGFVVSAYAQTTPNYLELTGEKNTYTAQIPAATITSYDGFTGESCDFVFAGGLTGANITKDFTFDSGLTWTTTATAGSSNLFINLSEGKTLTINKTFQFNSSKTVADDRIWFGSFDDTNTGKVVINAELVKNSTQTLYIFAFRHHIQANAKINANLMMFNAATFQTTVEQSLGITWRGSKVAYDASLPKDFVVDTSKSGVRNQGKIVVDGTTFEATSMGFNRNDESDQANYQHVFSVEFAQADKAESFKNKGFSSLFKDAYFDGVFFEKMDLNDKIYSTVDLTASTYEGGIFVNGVKLSELLENGAIATSKDATYGYIYTMTIPEPAEWAGILGALAIAFAFMRRQPRK